MIASTQQQAWLFYEPLAKQAALLKDDLLDPVDRLLEDAHLIELVRDCLASRSAASTRTGRTGMAPDRLLRGCVLKHLKGWSFRQLARELRCNLIYRRFTHFDAEATPTTPSSVEPAGGHMVQRSFTHSLLHSLKTTSLNNSQI
jgi:hypothetical protein